MVELRCRVSTGFDSKPVFYGKTERVSRDSLVIHLDIGEQASESLRIDRNVSVLIDLPQHRLYGKRLLRCDGKIVGIASACGTAPRFWIEVSSMSFCEEGLSQLAAAVCQESSEAANAEEVPQRHR